MWRQLYDTVKAVMLLTEDLNTYQEELKDMRQELRQLTGIVQRLAARMEANEKMHTTEHENLVLKLQLELTRMEQRLDHRLPSEKRLP